MTQVLAEHFHHTPIRRDMIVNQDDGFHRTAILNRKDIPEAIRVGLVGTEEAEVRLPGISGKRVSQQLAELARRLMALCSRPGHLKRIISEWRQIQIDQQLAAIGVWIGSHAASTCRRQFSERWDQAALLVERFFWVITAQPLLKEFQTSWIGLHIG